MSREKTVELFYDVLSPYSWIAFELLLRCRPVWNIHVDLQPVFLAGIKAGSDNTAAGSNPTINAYFVQDVRRTFEYYNLGPMNPPKDLINVLIVKGSLPTMRLLTAAKISHADKLERLSREFWTRVYRTGEDHVSPDSLLEACKKVGMSVAQSEQLLEDSTTLTVKDKLKETTQRALYYGAFGVPIFLVEGHKGKKEMFFGSDRFHLIAHCLGAKWPLISTAESKL